MDSSFPPREAGRYVAAIYRVSMRRHGALMSRLGLPRAAFRMLLRLLRHDDISQDELADDVLLDKATVARTVEKLEKAGYVTRAVDAQDGRVKRVRITDKGRELGPEFRAALGEWNDILLEGFTAEEAAAAMGFLERMAANARRHSMDC